MVVHYPRIGSIIKPELEPDLSVKLSPIWSGPSPSLSELKSGPTGDDMDDMLIRPLIEWVLDGRSGWLIPTGAEVSIRTCMHGKLSASVKMTFNRHHIDELYSWRNWMRNFLRCSPRCIPIIGRAEEAWSEGLNIVWFAWSFHLF